MKTKRSVEFLLVRADIKGAGLQKILSKSRNQITVDLVWPRSGIARKSVAREAKFTRSKADFTAECWTKRVLFREEIEDHAGLAVSVSEPLSTETVEKFLRLTAKYALKTGADMVEKYTVGISDIASAPIDALAAMAGTYPGPKPIAQGVCDLPALPAPGEERELEIPLVRVRRISGRVTETPCGALVLLVRTIG